MWGWVGGGLKEVGEIGAGGQGVIDAPVIFSKQISAMMVCVCACVQDFSLCGCVCVCTHVHKTRGYDITVQ